MRKASFRSLALLLAVLLLSHASPAIAAASSAIRLPRGSIVVTTSTATRVKVEVAIRRIKGLLAKEKKLDEESLSEILQSQTDLH